MRPKPGGAVSREARLAFRRDAVPAPRGLFTHRHRWHIRAEHPPTVQDAVVIETAIERGVIVPARRGVRMVEDWIDRAHTNPDRDTRRDGRLLLLLSGCILIGQVRFTPAPDRALISIAQNQATLVTWLDVLSS